MDNTLTTNSNSASSKTLSAFLATVTLSTRVIHSLDTDYINVMISPETKLWLFNNQKNKKDNYALAY